jgi:outer membrane protein assembly factor BamB
MFRSQLSRPRGLSSDLRWRGPIAWLLALGLVGAVTVALPPAMVLAAPNGDWLQFHNGPAHQGNNTQESILSASNVAALGVAWTGTGLWFESSSPAVADGVVYIGSRDDHLYAFPVGCANDGASCAPVWKAATGGVIESSPAVINGVVYVGSADGKLYAFAVGCNTGGGPCSPIWTGATGGAIEYSSPAVSNDVVYIGSEDGKLYAFAVGCNTGGGPCSPIWTGATGNWITSAPAVAGGVVYVGSRDNKLYAFAVGCNTGGGPCSPIWTGATGNVIVSSPAVAGGVVYVGSEDGKLYAFEVGCNTGGGACTPLWTGWADGSGISYSSPAVANGVVYIGSQDHKLLAFDAAGVTGCSATHCAPIWTGATGNVIVSSPAVANGVVYVGSDDNKLYAFAVGCSSGGGACAPLWTGTTGGVIESSPAVSNGVVYVGSNDGKLYALSLPTSSTYVPLTPTRLLDTRNGTGGLSGPFTNHVARTFTVTGVPSGATAVTGNLTVTGQTSGGYLFIGPVATNNPGSSTLNFPVGDDRANAVTVALGTGGTLSITFVAPSNGPTAHAIFDVTGYFSPDTSGATYHALSPTRALDTRNGTGGLSGPFTNHVARTFTVTGVPSGATAVTGNLTVTGQTSGGYLFIGPVATNNPGSSTLNFPVGDDRANAVTVALGTGGTLSITFVAPSNGPTAHAIFDVTGYFMS